MKTSTALKKTLQHLWDGSGSHAGKETRICSAAFKAGQKTHEKVYPIIMKLLEPHLFLETWLLAKEGVVNPMDNPRKFQATRKAWLLHLIAEYEAKGD